MRLSVAWLLGLSMACATTASGEAGATKPVVRDAIVVLGHRPPLEDGVIAPELRLRVAHGIALFEAGRAERLLFTGGASPGQPSEAMVMAQYARQHDVAESALRMEGDSRDTLENARLSVKLLRDELGRAPRIVLVTSDYHQKRAARLFRCAGADVESAPASLKPLGVFARMGRGLRETGVRVVYWFFDECERVKTGR
jgi:uncharacterized SAM-binding protein YcdF (DUF218 family)